MEGRYVFCSRMYFFTYNPGKQKDTFFTSGGGSRVSFSNSKLIKFVISIHNLT